MALDRKAIDDVLTNVDESIEGMYRALDRIRDCGLNDSEQRMFKEHLWEIIALLYRTYTIVDFTED